MKGSAGFGFFSERLRLGFRNRLREAFYFSRNGSFRFRKWLRKTFIFFPKGYVWAPQPAPQLPDLLFRLLLGLLCGHRQGGLLLRGADKPVLVSQELGDAGGALSTFCRFASMRRVPLHWPTKKEAKKLTSPRTSSLAAASWRIPSPGVSARPAFSFHGTSRRASRRFMLNDDDDDDDDDDDEEEDDDDEDESESWL